MLRPRADTALPASQVPVLLTELPTWNPLTLVEELPQKLQQLRQAQLQLNRMLADAEGQVLHFLRKGPLAGRQPVVKGLIERFYQLGGLAATHSSKVDKDIVDENVTFAASGASVAHWDKFAFAWVYNSGQCYFSAGHLSKFASQLDWSAFASNPLIDWTETLVRQHKYRTADFFAKLSTNTGIVWSSQFLTAFAFEWDYTKVGLLGNSGLPWEDEALPEKLRELHAAKYDHDNDEEIEEDESEAFLSKAAQAATGMRNRYWDRRSADRHCIWNADNLRQHTDQFGWNKLSANPALPFSFALLTEFEGQWNWDTLASNHGLYQKVLQPLLSDTIVDEFLTLYKD